LAKFIFPFQAVLNIKTKFEDKLKNELGQAIQELERQKSILRGIEIDMQKITSEFRTDAQNVFTVGKIKDYREYISFLKERIENQKINVKSAALNVDSIREELLKVSREKEMLSKLRSKQYEEYLYEQQKIEQRTADETINYKKTMFAGDIDA
jgi:flagellar protein FliJ